ncbi:MAG: outer membrane lipoprotein-sorting protein [Candidatus Delongbacteria bacterium]|nr:outer membrane lipoprotein-sorting protein [Candidatus Delongbacteria bacterium]
MLLTGLMAQTSLDGRQIMQKVKDRPDGDSRHSHMTLTLINKNNSVRERKVESFSIDLGKDKKTIMFFLYPGDVRGTGFLTWDYDLIGKEDDKWLYLPAMKKTRRISGESAKKDYFMGTDFTYDDMGSRNVDEDKHTLIKEEILDGFKCWVVESIPLDKRDIYSRKLSWVRQDCLIVVRAEYYDKLSKLHRRLILSEIKVVDSYWVAQRLHMTNDQTQHQTVITIENPEYDIKLNETLFTVTRLEKGTL